MNMILLDGKIAEVTPLFFDKVATLPPGRMYFTFDYHGTERLLAKPQGEAVMYLYLPQKDALVKAIGYADVRYLWEDFGNVAMNPETECMDFEWLCFPEGTFREDIWHWFEEEFGISVGKLMYDTDGYKYYLNHRPFSVGSVPKGFFDFVEDDPNGRYGAVYYDSPLTEQEVMDYELMPAYI